MPVEFVTASKKAIDKANGFDNEKPKLKYPLDQLQKGESFRIPQSEGNYNTLKTYCSQKSKDGKRFIVVEHNDTEPTYFEVYRHS